MSHKSDDMAAHAEKHGWRTVVKTDLEYYEQTENVEDIYWNLYAIRGDEEKREVLKVQWKGDLQIQAFYKYGDYELHPARKAPVIKLIEGQPDPKKFKREIPKEEKKNLTVEEKLEMRNVPWGDDPPAFDILIGVLDKTITWISPMTGEERSEFCSKQSNLRKGHFKVKTTKAGKRVLEWASSTGFCACYIDSIIDVT